MVTHRNILRVCINFVKVLHKRILSPRTWLFILFLCFIVLCVLLADNQVRNYQTQETIERVPNLMMVMTPQNKATDKIRNEDIYRQRHDLLLQVCKGNENVYVGNNTEFDVKDRLIYDKTHKLIYCAIEKIGSTFWKRIIQILIGYRKTNNPFNIRGIEAHGHYETLKKYSFDKIHVLLENTTKFLFVREPYARLLSGYVDKLFSPNSLYWLYVGKYIVKYFRRNPTNRSLDCGHDITFPEFIDYFIHSQEANRHRNGHFTPSYDHCRPCQLKYNIIGKLETFKDDTVYILKKLGVEKLVQIPDFQKDTEVDTLTDAVDNVYAMRPSVIKCMPFTEALFRIWKKMIMRGILSKNIAFPYPRHSRVMVPASDFSQALLDAHAQSGPREERIKNREEALKEAYGLIDPMQLYKLKKILEPDCKIFGYDSEPALIFNHTATNEYTDFGFLQTD